MGQKATLRLRVSQQDVHYAGNLVSGAHLLEYFGDIATELLIRHDGDEGLFRAYDNVEFLAPVYAGDYLEVEGEITKVGTTSRKMSFSIKKVISPCPTPEQPSKAQVLETPLLVARATGTCVVPLEYQKGSQK